jgi:transcriptional regulator with XRE-family HTH domain
MAHAPRRTIARILIDARMALKMSQAQFGAALGSSKRTASRWDTGRSTPVPEALQRLAALLAPAHRGLADEVAGAMGQTLVSLGLETQAPAAAAGAAPVSQRDRVDLVVLAAVEGSGLLPSAVRAVLHAAVKRARELGLSIDAIDDALKPGPRAG